MSNSQQIQPKLQSQSHASAQPAEQNTSAPLTRKQQMLLDFLHECNAPHASHAPPTSPPTSPEDHDPPACPLCGYNLQALTRPVCPECGQELKLAVGAAKLYLGWLIIALAPGIFSGICAAFTLFMITMHLIFIGSTWPIIVIVDVFGWCSGAFAIILSRKRWRNRFLAQSRRQQIWFALAIWLIHIAALGLFILIGNMIS